MELMMSRLEMLIRTTTKLQRRDMLMEMQMYVGYALIPVNLYAVMTVLLHFMLIA
jgi:hypothetical protein